MQATIETMQAHAKEAQERNTDQLKAMQEHNARTMKDERQHQDEQFKAMQTTIQTMQAQAKEAQERNTELQQQIRDLGSQVTQILSLLEGKTAGST